MGDRLSNLRQRVDDESDRVAQLARRVELLEGRVEASRAEADRAEAALHAATRESEGFFEIVWSYGARTFEALPWLPMLVGILAVVISVAECLAPEDDVPFAFAAMGSAFEAAVDGALPGSRCEVSVSETTPPPEEHANGRCRALVTCDEVVLDAEVLCRMEERSYTDDEGDTVWRDVLVVEEVPGDEVPVSLDAERGILDLGRRAGPRSLHVVLHRMTSEGSL